MAGNNSQKIDISKFKDDIFQFQNYWKAQKRRAYEKSTYVKKCSRSFPGDDESQMSAGGSEPGTMPEQQEHEQQQKQVPSVPLSWGCTRSPSPSPGAKLPLSPALTTPPRSHKPGTASPVAQIQPEPLAESPKLTPASQTQPGPPAESPKQSPNYRQTKSPWSYYSSYSYSSYSYYSPSQSSTPRSTQPGDPLQTGAFAATTGNNETASFAIVGDVPAIATDVPDDRSPVDPAKTHVSPPTSGNYDEDCTAAVADAHPFAMNESHDLPPGSPIDNKGGDELGTISSMPRKVEQELSDRLDAIAALAFETSGINPYAQLGADVSPKPDDVEDNVINKPENLKKRPAAAKATRTATVPKLLQSPLPGLHAPTAVTLTVPKGPPAKTGVLIVPKKPPAPPAAAPKSKVKAVPKLSKQAANKQGLPQKAPMPKLVTVTKADMYARVFAFLVWFRWPPVFK